MPTAPFSPPGLRRVFAHPDGRRYALQVVDCRVYESWRGADQRGGGNTAIRADDDDARAHARAKVKDLFRRGFVEGAAEPGLAFDLAADVVAAFHADLDAAGRRRHDYQPVAGRPHVCAHRNASVAEWLVTSDDRRRGVALRSSVARAALPEDQRQAMATALLDVLALERAAIFADDRTPVRTIELTAPIGRFTRLVVLAPVVENATTCRDVNIADHTLGRSIYRAFPAFACEVTARDSVAIAEARCRGTGAIPWSRWDRTPHPVFDLAYVKRPGAAPVFLVHAPTELPRRLGAPALAKLREAEVRVRNYRGDVRTFVRGDAPDLAELRAWLGDG